MPCRRRGRTPGSGETGRPRTRGGLGTSFGESGLPAAAPGAPGGPSSGSLASPSVHLQWVNAAQGRELAPVDSNHHTQIQSLVSCRWTRGQCDGKNLHYDPVRRRGAACCGPTRRLGSGVNAARKLPKADVAGAPQLRGPSWNCTVVPNTTRGGGAVSQYDGHKRSEALARLGE